MVGPAGAVEADFVVGLDGCEHVRRPIVVKRFNKVVCRAANVAKVGEMNLVLFAEMADRIRDVDTHGREVALAEGDAVVFARHHVDSPLKIVDVTEEARDAPEWRERRIVGMEGQVDFRLLRDRNDPFQEVSIILPEPIFLNDAGLG